MFQRRLDQKEHFRQVNIYAQRKIYESSEAIDGNLLEKSNIIRKIYPTKMFFYFCR